MEHTRARSASRPGPRVAALLLLLATHVAAANAQEGGGTLLPAGATLRTHGVVIDTVRYKDRRAVRVREDAAATRAGPALALIDGALLGEGTIEAWVAGTPAPGAPEGARGFIGLAYHVQDDVAEHQAFYLRPTNGRAMDQLRRNHSTQYVAHPAWTWQRLRTESPGVFESYVDLVPGEWTRMRIVVRDTLALLYVGDAAEPVLVIPDQRSPRRTGRVALWIGQGTDAYFTQVRITPDPARTPRN